MDKWEFKRTHGFWPHEEKCICGWRRADHTIWNTEKNFNCKKFRGTGQKL